MIVRASGSMTAVVGTANTATAVTAMLLGPSGANQLTSSGNSITVRPPRQACTTNGQISRNQRSNCGGMAARPKQQGRRGRRGDGRTGGGGVLRKEKGDEQRRCRADRHIENTVHGDRKRDLRLIECHQHDQIAGDRSDQPSIAVTRGRKPDQAGARQREQAQTEWQRIIDEQPNDNHGHCRTRGAADNAHRSTRQRDRQG